MSNCGLGVYGNGNLPNVDDIATLGSHPKLQPLFQRRAIAAHKTAPWEGIKKRTQYAYMLDS